MKVLCGFLLSFIVELERDKVIPKFRKILYILALIIAKSIVFALEKLHVIS